MAVEQENEPPVSQILTTHGLAENVSMNAINNACRLARSTLNLALVLERPPPMIKDYTYDEILNGAKTRAEPGSAAYEGCSVLREINDTIIEMSKGTYSLDDISILYTKPFLPNEEGNPARTSRAHECFWNQITTDPPKTIVIMTAHAGYTPHPGIQKLWSSLENAGEKETCTLLPNKGGGGGGGGGGDNTPEQTEKNQDTIIRAFHPSVYLRTDYNAYWSDDERALARTVLRACLAQGLYEATRKAEYKPRVRAQLWQDWRALLKCDSREIMALISVAGNMPDSDAAYMLEDLGSCPEYHLSVRHWKDLFEG